MFTLIHKILKKRRLIKKYTYTDAKKYQDLEYIIFMGSDENIAREVSLYRQWEMRFANRLKKL